MADFLLAGPRAVIADMADRVLVLGDGRIQQERRNPQRRPARELAW